MNIWNRPFLTHLAIWNPKMKKKRCPLERMVFGVCLTLADMGLPWATYQTTWAHPQHGRKVTRWPAFARLCRALLLGKPDPWVVSKSLILYAMLMDMYELKHPQVHLAGCLRPSILVVITAAGKLTGETLVQQKTLAILMVEYATISCCFCRASQIG